MDSILISIKKLLGIEKDYEYFDMDIVMHINSVFMILCQLGIGPDDPFQISSDVETWDDFYAVAHQAPKNLVRSYMYLKVRLLFDPPTTGVLHEAMERQIKEFEWRLNAQAETGSDGVATMPSEDFCGGSIN